MTSREPDPAVRARDVAMRLLGRREYSRAELQHRLNAREFAYDLVENLLKELEERHLLSDERFAESLVSNRVETGYGPRRIVLELKDRGVADDLAQKAMVAAEVDWDQHMVDQVVKKFGIQHAESFSEWTRRAKYLERRGFHTEAITRVIGRFDHVDGVCTENEWSD